MASADYISLVEIQNFIERVAERKDWLYIFSPCSIGDFFYNGGLSYAVQKRKNKSATVLVVKERMKNLGVTYNNVAQILYMSNEAMNAVQKYFYATANYEADNYIYGHLKMNSGKYVWDENIHLIDRYKKDVFNISLDTPFVPPIVKKISEENERELHSKYTLDARRTVIIFPYVHSTRQIDMIFWETLAARLRDIGCVVYTNVDGISEKFIAGTEPIFTSMPELYYISDKVKCFIGSRNGVMDFLAMTKAKILNINPFPDWLWDISVLFPNCNNQTFYNAVEYLRPVVEYFKKSNVNAEMNISHAHINPANVYSNYGNMLDSILSAVKEQPQGGRY